MNASTNQFPYARPAAHLSIISSEGISQESTALMH